MLKKISENIWEFPYRAKLGPGISFPTRTTVFQLENKVILYSPGPFEKEDVELISSWGKEILIVAPNLFHHFYFQAVSELFPKAKCFGPEGLEKKNKSISTPFRTFDELATEVPELSLYVLQGVDKIKELLIYSPNDKALIVCDLFFNMKRDSINFLTSILLSIVGANDKFAQSRLFKHFVDRHDVFLESTLKAFDNNIEMLIPAHGEVSSDIEQAKSILRRSFS